MFSIVAVLVMLSINQLFGTEIPVSPISNTLMWICAVLTVYSGAEYIIRNRSIIKEK